MGYEINNASRKHDTIAIDSMLYDALGETYSDMVEVVVTRNNNVIVVFNDDAVRQIVFEDNFNVIDIITL